MSRKRVAIIITLFCVFSVIVLGYATMRGLRESGALSKYQVWVTNTTSESVFVHALGTPHKTDPDDFEEFGDTRFGEMQITNIMPGRTAHLYSKKVRKVSGTGRIHPERYFILADAAYRAGETFVLSSSSGLDEPSIRSNSAADLIEESTLIQGPETHFQIIKNDDELLRLIQVKP